MDRGESELRPQASLLLPPQGTPHRVVRHKPRPRPPRVPSFPRNCSRGCLSLTPLTPLILTSPSGSTPRLHISGLRPWSHLVCSR